MMIYNAWGISIYSLVPYYLTDRGIKAGTVFGKHPFEPKSKES